MTMNYSVSNRMGTNRGIHKIDGSINGSVWMSNHNVENQNMMLFEVTRFKSQMLEKMKEMANNKPEKTFSEKMHDLGFTN